MPRTVPLILSGLLILAAATPVAAQTFDQTPTPPGPWYVDPVELGPLYAYRDDRTLPLWAYPGDEDATDFANRYGCKPVWGQRGQTAMWRRATSIELRSPRPLAPPARLL